MNRKRFALSLAASFAVMVSLQPIIALAQQASPPPVYRSLYADRKAFKAGDILTVLITESAAASATARTRTDKEDNAFATIAYPGQNRRYEAGLGSDFTGGGEIQRTGKLLAKLAVVVDGIDANGNLIVHGEQDINVNNEAQRIALSGTVRTEDIAPDNTIASWRVSGAKIEFKGRGILARKQSPGLLTIILGLFGVN